MTEEEQAIVLSHYTDDEGNTGGGLVGWFISKYNLDYDEWHGIITESLIKSVIKYDESKGKLSSFFHTIASNDMNNAFNKANMEMFTGFEDSIEKELEEGSYDYYGIYLEKYIASLSPRRQQVVFFLIDGYSHRDIAKLLSVHHNTIYRDILHIKESLSEWMKS